MIERISLEIFRPATPEGKEEKGFAVICLALFLCALTLHQSRHFYCSVQKLDRTLPRKGEKGETGKLKTVLSPFSGLARPCLPAMQLISQS